MSENSFEQTGSYENTKHIIEVMKTDPTFFEKMNANTLRSHIHNQGLTWMEESIYHTVTSDTEFGKGKGATHCFLSLPASTKNTPRVIVKLTVSDSKKFNIKEFETEETANRSKVAQHFSDGDIYAGVNFRHWFAESPEQKKVEKRISRWQVEQRRGVLGNLLDAIRKKKGK